MPDKDLVSTAKPKVGGACHRAPVGTALPTDATSNLGEAWTALGYFSEDGLTNGNSRDFNVYRAWGGDIVDSSGANYTDTFQFKMIEVLNADVLETVHGTGNVSGTLEEGIVVKAKGDDTAYAWVFDMIMKGGTLRRVVVPSAAISSLGDVVYKGDELAGYDATITAEADSDGYTHYEYMKKGKVTSGND